MKNGRFLAGFWRVFWRFCVFCVFLRGFGFTPAVLWFCGFVFLFVCWVGWLVGYVVLFCFVLFVLFVLFGFGFGLVCLFVCLLASLLACLLACLFVALNWEEAMQEWKTAAACQADTDNAGSCSRGRDLHCCGVRD